jgi:two-component system sporulation sensor kinase A
MSLQGLSRKLGDTEHGRPLEIALQETDRLDRVAGGVLTLGRRPGGKVAEVWPVTLVEQALQALESEFGERRVNATVRDDSSGASIEADGEALKGALINLLRNAMEAMPDGGTIEIGLDAHEGGPVAIHIKDQGPGVPPDLADRIFNPFVTTKDRGNGFGLPLALQAVEANGGRLRLVESDGPKGAHFVIELPIEQGL